ncbi:glycosyltransferase [Arthrobacter monumenti]
MRHNDERRVGSTLEEARQDELLSDPTSLVTRYQGMAVRDKTQQGRISQLEAQLQKATAELSTLRNAVEQKGEQNARLKHELAEVSQTLYNLRRSWRVRAGKALTEPIRLVWTVVRHLRAVKSRTGSRRSAMAPERNDVGNGRTSTGGGFTETQADSPATKYARLLESVSVDTRAANVISLIQHSYFTMGNIREPAALAEQHEALLEATDSKVANLIATVRGLDSLYGKELYLPPRQANAGYLAEPGRVMYCVHSTAAYNSNGYSTRTSGLSTAIAELGEDLVVMARPGYPWDVQIDRAAPPSKRFEAEANGISYIYTPGPSLRDDRIDHYIEQAADAYVREAMKNRVSAIHAASNYLTAYPALVAARRLGVPFIYEVRGLWEITEASGKPGWESTERFAFAVQMENAVVDKADGILAITDQVAGELVERGAIRDKIRVVPNAVDPEIFAPLLPHQATRERLGIPDESMVVGYAGSLTAYEGIADLLDAMSIVREHQADFRLVIVGDGPVLADLKKRSRELNISDQVIFAGRVKPQEVAKYISIFDIMPCPRRSVRITELVPPLKPMEAMACSKAVILSNLAPLRDLAGRNEEKAIIFGAGDVESLAATLVRLAEDSQLRSDLGRRARRWILEERTWTAVGQIVREEYARVLKRVETKASPGRPLKDLRIALIADEFTTAGLRAETNIVELAPDQWEGQLADAPIDALIVESAWEGKSGEWRRKVGYYDEQSFDTLRSILERCQNAGIPTIFWNKEDPVHFERFVKSSTFFEHIFTTDANSIINYLRNAGSIQKTVSSLPFYAQPHLHNPLPSNRKYEHTVAYAGSFYGDRYARRSEQLVRLLTAATSKGLTIYDRQHLNPQSPYKFPDDLGRFVAGGLSYAEVVQAYKAHPVHINVNSVEDSPTMFSRRVVEAAASGTMVVSGPGAGVEDVFDGRIPVVSTSSDAQILIDRLMTREGTRKNDAWLGMRTVYRAHTAGHRLTYMLRTAGVSVDAPTLPTYAVVVEDLTDSLLTTLQRQSVLPSRILYFGSDSTSKPPTIDARPYSARELAALENSGIVWVGQLPEYPVDRVYFEDLLAGTLYGSWSGVTRDRDGWEQRGYGLAHRATIDSNSPGLKQVGILATTGTNLLGVWQGRSQTEGEALRLIYRQPAPGQREDVSIPSPKRRRKKVVVAGHDLKFATKIIEDLEERGHTVVIDEWQSHSEHDPKFSGECLREADAIFCEWALGAAVWYSQNKARDQRLTVRFHSQELFTVFPERIEADAVDEFIFVGPHIRDMAIRDSEFDPAKCQVIPNYVDNDSLHKPKTSSARFNLGMVGIVPQGKRLDRALDVLERLRTQDKRFKLYIKGKTPDDYPWMANRPNELAFYEAQYDRIADEPLLKGAVTFDGFSSDMGSWYQKIGVALSVSDFESFHLTLADGAASGALPAALAWSGADRIYPLSWSRSDIAELTSYIADTCLVEEVWREEAGASQQYAQQLFSSKDIVAQLSDAIEGHSS